MKRHLAFCALAFFVLPSHAQVPDCVAAPPGLVGWWRAESNGADSAGTNDGSLINGVSFQPGLVGQAFWFVSGPNPKVYVPDNPNLALTNSLTIEAWIKANFGWTLLSRGDDRPSMDSYTLGFTDSSTLVPVFEIYDSSGQYLVLTAPAPIPTNVWVHIAATLDGDAGIARIYINGQVVAETTTPLHPAGPLTGANPSLCIGNAPGSAAFPFDGLIDEMSLYSRALSAAEIQAIYQAGSAGKCTGGAPTITLQPSGQVGYWGRSVTFVVGANGAPPLSYLWYKDDFAISWATNSSLVLTNLGLNDGGSYSVVVSNAFGTAVSSNAFLTVNPAGVSLGLYAGLTIEGAVGNNYGIQFTTNVSQSGSWTTLGQITLTQPVQLWMDTNVSVTAVGSQRRFYRVVALP
jgi:hypothetical protein